MLLAGSTLSHYNYIWNPVKSIGKLNFHSVSYALSLLLTNSLQPPVQASAIRYDVINIIVGNKT